MSSGRLCCVRLLLEAKADANVAKDDALGGGVAKNEQIHRTIGTQRRLMVGTCWVKNNINIYTVYI